MEGLRVAELAERAGVAASTVRFYERAGLLSPARRAENGYRLFGESALVDSRPARRRSTAADRNLAADQLIGRRILEAGDPSWETAEVTATPPATGPTRSIVTATECGLAARRAGPA